MRRLLASLAIVLGLSSAAQAADCWPSATSTSQSNCGAVMLYLDVTGKSAPVTAAAPLPVTIISGGSGGGAMTVADGANVVEGATADAAATAGGAGTLSAKLRLLTTQFNTLNTTVSTAANQTTANTSLASIATNTTGAATAAKQDTGNTSLGSIDTKLSSQATAANQSTANTSLSTIATNTTGASTAANQTSVQAPVAPATATATKSELVGCQATSAAINPTTGQQAAVDCDLNNNLLVSSGGAPNLAISQVSVATSDTAVVSARALRRSVTIQQITGTQNVFCNQTTATAANGVVLPAVVGASVTFNTTSAVRCIAITGAQTVAVAETF